MEFWTTQQGLSAADIAAQGKTERFARKWRNTTVAAVDKLDASGDAAVKTAFLHICARLGSSQITGKDSKIAALQSAAATMKGDATALHAVPARRVKAFVAVLLEEAAASTIEPPVVLVKEEEEELAAREPPTAEILVADPRAYIASIIAGQPAVPDEGQLTAEDGGEGVAKWIARGKKQKAKLLPETRRQMPRAMGRSRSVTGEGMVDALTDAQMDKLLDMAAVVDGLPRVPKKSSFLSRIEEWGLDRARIKQVTQAVAEVRKGMPRDRKEANLLFVAADLLRRSAVVHTASAGMDEGVVMQMEQAAALVTQLGVHKLQRGGQEQAQKVCSTFGLVRTGELERMVADPEMMDGTKEADVQKQLTAAFEMKRSMGCMLAPAGDAHGGSGGWGSGNGRGRSGGGGPDEWVCYGGYGADCYDLRDGRACTHERGSKYARGKGKGKGAAKGKGKGKGRY